MKNRIAQLAARPWVNGILAAAFFLAVVLPHELVGAWVAGLLLDGDIAAYNLRVLAIAFLVLALFLYPLARNLARPRHRPLKLGYLLLTLALMALAYATIMVLATETAHYLQYALLALLLFPLTGCRYGETLFWATLLGALDEGYQYFYLAPDKNLYYDLNDVVINFLGAAFGLAFLRTFDPAGPAAARPLSHSPALRTAAGLLAAATTAWLAGYLHLAPPPEAAPGLVLVKQAPTAFWSSFHQYRFHVIRPGEAVLLLALLFLAYRGLPDGRWRWVY